MKISIERTLILHDLIVEVGKEEVLETSEDFDLVVYLLLIFVKGVGQDLLIDL